MPRQPPHKSAAESRNGGGGGSAAGDDASSVGSEAVLAKMSKGISFSACSIVLGATLLGIMAVTVVSLGAYSTAMLDSERRIREFTTEQIAQHTSGQVDAVGVLAQEIAWAVKQGRLGLSDVDALDKNLLDNLMVFRKSVSLIFITEDATGRTRGVANVTHGGTVAFDQDAAGACTVEYTIDPETYQRTAIPDKACVTTADKRTQDWYKAATSSQHMVMTDPYWDPVEGVPVVTISTNITAWDGTFIGVVGVDVNLAYFQSLALELVAHAKEATEQDKLDAFIVSDHDHTLVASTQPHDVEVLREEQVDPSSPILHSMDDAVFSADSRAVYGLVFVTCKADLHACSNFTEAADPALYVSVAFLSSPAFTIPWTVAVAVPERNLAADRVWSFTVTFIVVAATIVYTVVGCIVEPRMRPCQQTPLEPIGRAERLAPSQRKGLQAVKGGARARRRAKLQQRRKRNKIAKALAKFYTPLLAGTFAAVGLVIVYVAWNSSVSAMDHTVTRMSSAVKLRLESTVMEFVSAPTKLVDVSIQGFRRGELPVTDAELSNQTRIDAMEQFFFDIVNVYRASRNRVTAIFVGYDNSFAYGVLAKEYGMITMYKDQTTGMLLKYAYTSYNGTRDLSKPPPQAEKVYATTERSWYTGSNVNETQWTAVYAFASGGFGVSAGRRWVDPVSNRTLVLAIDLALADLDTIVNEFGLPTDTTAMFISEMTGTKSDPMPLVAATVGSTFHVSASGSVERAAATSSDSEMVKLAAKRVNETASFNADGTLKEVNSVELTAGWGVNRMFVDVAAISVAGLQWVMVVALQQSLLLEKIQELQNISFLIGGGSIVITVYIAMLAVSRARRRLEEHQALRKQQLSSRNLTEDIDSDSDSDGEMDILGTLARESLEDESARFVYDGITSFIDTMCRAAPNPRPIPRIPAPTKSAVVNMGGSGSRNRRRGGGATNVRNPLTVDADAMTTVAAAGADKEQTPHDRVQAMVKRVKTDADRVLWRASAYAAGVVCEPEDLTVKQKFEIVNWVIQRSLEGQNPLRHIHTVLSNQFNATRIALFEIHGNKWWGRFIILTCTGLMFLSFWEAQLGAAEDPLLVTEVLTVEGILLSVLLVELVMFWLVHRIRTKLPLQRFATSPAVPIIEMGCIGKHKARWKLGLARSIIVAIMLADWVVRVIEIYPTGPYVTDITGDGGELVSADLLIPYTTWLRPVILYFMSQQMRASSNHLAITVVRSYSVWALTASFLVVSAILSTAFFQNTQVADPDAPQFEEGLGRAFQDFRSSFLSMFIFVCTAANFSDIVNPAMHLHWIYMVYFWVLAFIGLFLIVSVMVAFFEKHFTDAHDRDEDKFKAQRDIRRRFGLMTAFHLLQTVHKQHRMESSKRRLGRKARQSIAQAVAAAAQRKALSAKDVVSRELLQEFLENTGFSTVTSAEEAYNEMKRRFEVADYDTHDMFSKLDSRLKHGTGVSEEFVAEVEDFAQRCKSLHMQARKVTSAEVFPVVNFIVHFERNAQLLSMENTADVVQAMIDKRNMQHHDLHLAGRKRYSVCSTDWLRDFFDNKLALPHESLFVMIMLLHVVLLALSASSDASILRALLYVFNLVHALDVAARILAEGAHDFWDFKRLRKLHEAGTNPYAAGALKFDVVVIGIAAGIFVLGALDDFNPDVVDVAMAIPAIRLLSAVSMTRRLVFGLVGSLPEHAAFFALLAVLMYVYGVTGVFWFAGLMEEDGFTTLINALGAMFQMMTGDWHEFMFGSVDAIGSLSTSLYYMSYVALVLLLFANVFIGIVVGQFSDMEAEQDASAVEERMKEYTKRFLRIQQNVAKRRLQTFFAKRRAQRAKAQASSSSEAGASNSRAGAAKESRSTRAARADPDAKRAPGGSTLAASDDDSDL